MDDLIKPLTIIVKSYLCDINNDGLLKYDPELMIYCLNKCYHNYNLFSMVLSNARYDNLDNIKWLYDHHYIYSGKTIKEATRDVIFIKWFLTELPLTPIINFYD